MNFIRSTAGILASLLFVSFFAVGAFSQTQDQVHTPAKDSPERKAIVAAVANEYKEGADHPSKFAVNYLKVHNGWAWINVTPQNASGTPVGDPAPLLFHNESGKWVNKDLVEVTPANDQIGPAEPDAAYIKALQNKYKTVPRDIIPAKHH